MTKKIQVHKITITKKGEKHSFQIALPRDAKRITGIQISYRILPLGEAMSK